MMTLFKGCYGVRYLFFASAFVVALFAVKSVAAIGSPRDVDGCVLWLDASDAGSLNISGGKVSHWYDLSGFNNTVSQPDVSKQPASNVDLLNGKNTLRFYGNEWLLGNPVLEAGAKEFTYFAVWRPNAVGGVQVVVEQADQNKASGKRAALLAADSTYGFSGEYNDSYKLASLKVNEWRVNALEVDGRPTRNITLWENGGAYGGAININIQDTGDAGICIGAKIYNKLERLNGNIGEIIVFDCVVSDTDRNSILYYLQQKWGIDCGVQDASLVIDFEHDSLPDGWVAVGNAFTNQPVCSTRKSFNKRGDWMIGSLENDKNGGNAQQGDGPTGSLTGTGFVLANNTVRARVGGGHKTGSGSECQLQLQRKIGVDAWQVVRKTTGNDFDTMRESCWNVHNLIGEEVRFVIVDNNSGGWGQIIVDDIRVMDEPLARNVNTSFATGQLVPELNIEIPHIANTVDFTTNDTLRIKINPGRYDSWSTMDRSPKVLLNAIDRDIFTLETQIASVNATNCSYQTGLILMFETASANSFDMIMFGPHSNGIVAEGPGLSTINAGKVGFDEISLRINGRKDHFVYSYSTNGVEWVEVGSHTTQGKVLLHAGIFCKNWGTMGNTGKLEIDYGYLKYEANPVPQGTLICIK